MDSPRFVPSSIIYCDWFDAQRRWSSCANRGVFVLFFSSLAIVVVFALDVPSGCRVRGLLFCWSCWRRFSIDSKL